MNAAIETPAPADTVLAPRRCALVECYDRHDELFPTLVFLLGQLGCQVEIFTTLRNRLRNPPASFGDLEPHLRTFVTAGQVLAAVRRERFDLVIFNTFEGRAVLDCAAQLLLDTPVIGIVHDGRLVGDMPGYLPFLAHPQVRLLVLAPHVAEAFAPLADAGTMYPVYFTSEGADAVPHRPGRRRFCALDLFDISPADQRRLLDALRGLQSEGRTDFEVCFAGSTLARPVRDFLRKARDAGLEDCVRHVASGLGGRANQRLLQSSDYVLSLLNPESQPRSFQSQSRSAVALALGHNAIPVSHADLARQYGVDDCAFTYTDGFPGNDLQAALRRALDTNDADLALARARLAAIRRRLLAASQQNLALTLEALGSRDTTPLRPPDLGPVEAMAG